MAWHPRALGFLAAIVAACGGLQHASVVAIVAGVLPVVLNVTVILAGFAMIAHAVLLALVDRPMVGRLGASGHWDAFIGCSWEAGRAMICFAGVAIAALVLQACRLRLPAHDRLVPALLAGCFAWVCFSGVGMNRLIFKLLRSDGARPAA